MSFVAQPSITSLLAQTGKAPNQLGDEHFAFDKQKKHQPKAQDRDMFGAPPKTVEELAYAFSQGRFNRRPSDLFLTIYHDVIKGVEAHPDPLVGIVSPSLLGNSGIVRASVVAHTREILHYYITQMLQTKTEILLSAGFWDEDSANAKIFVQGLVLLNQKLLRERPGQRITVKILWDRGPSSLVKTQTHVSGEKLRELFPLGDMEMIDLEVVNYHKPVLGVLHIKYLIIDREHLFMHSNNLHDKANMELSVHLQGEIVNSYYDTFLINWGLPLTSPLPLINIPAQTDLSGVPCGVLGHAPLADMPVNLALPVPAAYTNRLGFLVTEPDAINPYIHPEPYLPLFLHSAIAQQPVPMAAVNRHPQGGPGHKHTRNPQDVAWKSAYRNAKRSIFVQTPDFNAKSAMKGVVQACRRGVKVTLWICFGYNAMKENIPFQGGDNVKTMRKLYRDLAEFKDNSDKNLFLHWHVSKGMKEPHEKTEHCHIKFMSVDDEVAIFGSGNMDVQSWFHSAEVNIMADSPALCAEWRYAFRMNQDTETIGKIDPNLPTPVDDQILRMLGRLKESTPAKFSTQT